MIYFSKSQEDFLKSTSLRDYETTSLQVYKQKRYVQIPTIRGDRNLQVTKSPSHQVTKSMSKKIRADTCDTRRQRSASQRVDKSTSKKIRADTCDTWRLKSARQ